MKYMGGKFRIGKELAPIILESKPSRIIEPFIGGANMTTHFYKAGYAGEYIGGDYDEDLNYFWQAVIEQGYRPSADDKPSREQYVAERNAGFSANPLRGFMRTAAAFSGRPWDSFVLERTERDYWGVAVRAVETQAGILADRDIKIVGGDYEAYEQFLSPESVVYCDPPYADTTDYRNRFDHDRFWGNMRRWSEVCPVFVSELTAPDDFAVAYEKHTIHTVMGSRNKKVSERLYSRYPISDYAAAAA